MTKELLIAILAMAGVTYLIRMLPLLFFRKKLDSVYVRSFFHYIPYTVLGAMTFPAVFYSTGSFFTATAGVVCAILVALKKSSLVLVALVACTAVYLTGML